MSNFHDIEVDHDVTISGEIFDIVFRTRHAGGVQAITAVHDASLPATIGGIRFVPKGTLEEVGHLARAMTPKNAAARLPAGGQKTIIICRGGISESFSERADIVAEHAQKVVAHYEQSSVRTWVALRQFLTLFMSDPNSKGI